MNSRPFVVTLGCLVFAANLAVPRPVLAQPKADPVVRARELFQEAEQRSRSQQYAEACPRFAESQRLDPRADTLSRLALCLEHEGKIASAMMRFGQLQRTARGTRPDLERLAGEHLRSLEPELPNLVVQVGLQPVAGQQIKLNGEVLGEGALGTKLPLDPGSYEIEASAPDKQPWRARFEMAKGQQRVLDLPPLQAASAAVLVPPHAETHKPPPLTQQEKPSGLGPQRTVALAAGGVGLAGVVVGTVFGFKSKSKHDAALDHCDGSSCSQDGLDFKAEAQSAGNVSTAAFIVGGVGLAAGAVLWFTAKPMGSGSKEIRLELGPRAIAMVGTW